MEIINLVKKPKLIYWEGDSLNCHFS